MNIDKFPIYCDCRGDLVPVEFSKIPFIPKRIFYVQNVPENMVRGEHGHFKCKQYYICVTGIIKVTIYDGKEQQSIMLNPGQGIFIDNMVWSSEKFCTGNDVLLVLCSHEYDKNDYFTELP